MRVRAGARARARLFDLHARVYRRRAVSGLTCACGRASVAFLLVSVAVLVVARVRVCASVRARVRVRVCACACGRVCVCRRVIAVVLSWFRVYVRSAYVYVLSSSPAHRAPSAASSALGQHTGKEGHCDRLSESKQ